MGFVRNRIPDALATFSAINTPASWTSGSCVISVAGESSFLSGYQTLKISPDPLDPTCFLEAEFYLDDNDVSREMVASLFVRCHLGGEARITLSDPEEYGIGGEVAWTTLEKSSPRAFLGTLKDGGWTVIRSNIFTPANTGTTPQIKIHIQFGSINTTDLLASSEPYIYISIPACYGLYEFQNNNSAALAFLGLPQVIRDYEQPAPPDFVSVTGAYDTLPSHLQWPIYRLLDVLSYGSGIAEQYTNEWAYTDYLDGFDGTNESRSKLVDPVVAPIAVLPWLNQFVGSRNTAGTATRTPWASVPSTWGSFSSLMDASGDADGILEWTEFESYKPSFAKSEETLRWQASTGYAGYGAGSFEALEQAVKFVLTGSKWVNIGRIGIEVSPTPPETITSTWTMTVQTYVEETPDVINISDTSALVEGIINDVKPVGVLILHELIEAP